MTIDNKRLALLEGKNPLPEEVSTGGMFYRSSMRSITIPPPNYATSPDDRERLWLYLMGKPGMYICFENWAWDKQQKSKLMHLTITQWLFSPLDGVPRWVSLLSEWLGMEETRNKFGWVDCPEFEKDIVCTFIECSQRNSGCAITGKIRAEWAR